jgi:uncharacterized protein YndB with AHSA1/START domain
MSALESAIVHRALAVPVSRERAFDFFVNRMIEWWPSEFTFSEDTLDDIAIEPFGGGRWYETDNAGIVTAWGTVHEYQPIRRLVLSWRISPQRRPEPDESRASLITVSFTDSGDAMTRIELEHSRFDFHADGAEVMYAGMDSPEGWTAILERYADRIVDNSEHAF